MGAKEVKILVIDDDRFARRGLSHWLNSKGFAFCEAQDGQEGLELAEELNPDLILLDLRMPGLDGMGFLNKFSGKIEDTPVVVVSGAGDQADTVSAFRLGAWDYVTKPIENMDLLEHCIQAALERKALRESVRKAMRDYRHLVNNLPLMLFVLRRDRGLAFVNNYCQPLLGYSPSEALDKPDWLENLVHAPDRERVKELLDESFSGCPPLKSVECRLEHSSGAILHVLLTVLPLRECEPGQEIESVEGFFLDITDRVLLEKFVVQKEKINTLGAITAEVAHEIRNPLMSIAGFARLLERKYPQEAGTKIILDESARLERILNRIRDYLHPVKMSPETCDMREIIESSLELLGPEIREKELRPALELSSAPANVYEDPDVLTQITLNLLRNAMQDLRSGESFAVRLFHSSGYLMLEVKSRAPHGLSDPELFFLPFDEGGQSIGLPFCYRMLKIMGGTLSFEMLNQEVVFTACLPVKEQRGDKQCAL